jgi:hypothetical protein
MADAQNVVNDELPQAPVGEEARAPHKRHVLIAVDDSDVSVPLPQLCMFLEDCVCVFCVSEK